MVRLPARARDQFRSPSLPVSRSVSVRGSVRGVNRSVSEADHSSHLVPRLRMSGAVPQLHLMLSWCAQGRLYVMLVYCEWVKIRKPIFASYRTPVGLIEWTAGLLGSPGDRVAAKISYWKPNAVITLSCYIAR